MGVVRCTWGVAQRQSQGVMNKVTLTQTINQSSRDSLVHVLSEIVDHASDHQVKAITRLFDEHMCSSATQHVSRE